MVTILMVEVIVVNVVITVMVRVMGIMVCSDWE